MPLPSIFEQINWLDIVFIILLLGMVYKGLRTGVGTQVLSLLGWFILLFFSIGYYGYFSQAIFGFLLQKWAKPLSFFLIASIIFIIIKLVERIFNVMHSEEVVSIERLGGAVLASFRAFMFFGAISILLLLIPVESVKAAAVADSKTSMFFVKLDAQLYSWMTKLVNGPEAKEREQIVESLLRAQEEGNGTDEA
ncbi:MAG: hypothetical protein GF409_08585 [Candidatus Omnitrophica bacterium]|nr:hypothetical protein [Candidatus Omnitrophota bacterium]